MAEGPERSSTDPGPPVDAPGKQEQTSPNVQAMPSIQAMPTSGPLEMPPRDEEKAYRPLSLVSLGSFLLAVLYALLLLIGGLTAFFNRAPFLLPAWTLIIPLAGVLVGWIARSQIQASEGTLAGAGLARGAMVIALVAGLIYTAYYAATYAAISRQAEAIGQKWLEEIRRGKIEQAFWMTVPPPRPAGQATSRDTLEVLYNSKQDPGGKGPFTTFAQSEYVRLLQQAGEQATIEAPVVQTWSYEEGGYQIQLLYRITSALADFPVLVTVSGVTSATGEFKGRQWFVRLTKSGLPNEDGRVDYHARGQELRALVNGAFPFADAWVRKFTSRDLEGAFLDTCPLPDRKIYAREQYQWLLPSLATGPRLPEDPQRREWLSRRFDFFTGRLARAEDGVFWSDITQRPEILETVRGIFQQGLPFGGTMEISRQSLPQVTQDGDVSRAAFDVHMSLPRSTPNTQPFLVDGQLIVEAKAEQGKSFPLSLRIDGIDLIRGRTAPLGGRGPGGR